MNALAHEIAGGDYANGGTATAHFKEMLKKIGTAPDNVRRAMIAAYEAEMNVVIHAHRGTMKIAVDPRQVDVVIQDEGPGIPDIERAMTEGFSTAPPEARELGFGAGMGLPNIRKNSDRFSIQSTPGRGTQVRFSIYLQQQQGQENNLSGVGIVPERCRQCLACVHACPMRAVRLRHGVPHILEHLCVNCTCCVAACASDALCVPGEDALPGPSETATLVLPEAFLYQFGVDYSAEQVLSALQQLGYQHIRFLEEWEQILREAAQKNLREQPRPLPLLLPVCPAVTELIQTRFPSLLSHIAPFLSPAEAVREEFVDGELLFTGICPSQHSILSPLGILTKIHILRPALLRNQVYARLSNLKKAPPVNGGPGCRAGPPPAPPQITGMRHVMRVLDEIENGRVHDYQILELYACEQACFGSPVWFEDPYVARQRALNTGRVFVPGTDSHALVRVNPLLPKTGVRLAPDMRTAVERLGKIEALARRLPGRDCGVCGAPTCAVFAEDIVLERADIASCLYFGLPAAGEKDITNSGTESSGRV